MQRHQSWYRQYHAAPQSNEQVRGYAQFQKFEGGEQFSISELFRHLQCTHNASSEMASHLAFLTRTLQPIQFEFILKHSVRPLVQFQIPPTFATLENFALPRVICPAKKLLNKNQQTPFYLTHTTQPGQC